MKRCLATLGMLAAIWFSTNSASAADPNCRNHTPRYRYGSYGVWVRTNAPGYPAYRYTYRGASSGFPPPAFLNYGYPHGNDSYGIGF